MLRVTDNLNLSTTSVRALNRARLSLMVEDQADKKSVKYQPPSLKSSRSGAVEHRGNDGVKAGLSYQSGQSTRVWAPRYTKQDTLELKNPDQVATDVHDTRAGHWGAALALGHLFFWTDLKSWQHPIHTEKSNSLFQRLKTTCEPHCTRYARTWLYALVYNLEWKELFLTTA